MRASRILRLAEEKGTRVLVALDFLSSEPLRLVEEVEEYVVGAKVGIPFVLRWGLEAFAELRDRFGDSLYMLCDFKLADIPEVVAEEVRLIGELGFDGAILHLYPGGAERAARVDRRPELFGLLSMTHAESRLLDLHFEELVEMARAAGLEGCVVPATKPHLIREARGRLPHAVLLSPGVGAQGAPIGSAVAVGADFEIVGRAITSSPDPRSAARAAREAINRQLK